MNRNVKVAMIGLGGALVVLSQSATLNVKPGEWHLNMTSMTMGKPMQYNSCIKASDRSISTWTSGSRAKCTWKVLQATSTDMELQGSNCDVGGGAGIAQIHAKIHAIDPEHTQGSFDVTVNAFGRTITNHAKLTGKWIAPTCTGN
jgi:hypothetical protein